MDLVDKYGKTYDTFKGSPLSKGILQFDMWGKTEEVYNKKRYDWKSLKEEIIKKGCVNSLLLAPMPTASTSQILGNNEAFEPFTSNLYTRRTLSGEFIVSNKYLIKNLVSLGLWNDVMKNRIMAANGSIQNIPEIPQNIKDVYKTVWEISQKELLNMSADRGKYICQSQSMNLHIANCNESKLLSAHFYGWKLGLKTGQYYLRTKAAVDAVKFTVDQSVLDNKEEPNICSIDNPDCESCSG